MEQRSSRRRPRRTARIAALLIAGAVSIPTLGAAQSAPLPVRPPATGSPVESVSVSAGAPPLRLPAVRALRISVATGALGAARAGAATISVETDVGDTPRRATFSLRDVPADVVMDFDLPHGTISVGGVCVGTFPPVAPLTDNLKFPVDVVIHRGASVLTAHRDITLLLPTVIIPGFSNEKRTRSDVLVVSRLARYGYTDAAPNQTLFWYPYQSHRVGLEEGARALAAYVRRTVLPATYAGKINVIGYSIGGLFARWLIAYDVDGWAALVNRLVLVAVPNEGVVMPYLGQHAPPFFPFAESARTPLARAMDPVFPFWRAAPGDSWSIPADDRNAALAALNARPIPPGIRLYSVYGDNDPTRTGGPQTAEGVTGELPGAEITYGPGDGIVLTASALGLSINGSPGVPSLERAVRVDVGRIYHVRVLEAGAAGAASALQDRFETAAQVAGPRQKVPPEP
jgi:hypothetical protein